MPKAAPISAWKARNSPRCAESYLYRSWGCSVIGMTAMPEAKLAREAELPYAIVAMVTDYDCWHPDHDHVTVDAVIKVMHENADNARRLIMAVAPKLGPERTALAARHRDTCSTRRSSPRRKSAIPRCAAKLDAVAGRDARRKGLNSWISKITSSAPFPTIPSRGSCSATSPPCSAIRAPSAARWTSWCSPMPACGSTRWRASRRAASSWAARWRISSPTGFVPVRKKGKLPYTVIGEDYALEYGKDRVEIHIDAVKKGEQCHRGRRSDRHRRHLPRRRSSCSSAPAPMSSAAPS